MPNWTFTVSGFKAALDPYSDEGPWEPRRDAAVIILESSKWYESQGDTDEEREYSDLGELISEWKAADDVDWADSILNQIYDLADDERAWLG